MASEMTLEAAMAVINAARHKAEALGLRMNIAVVDAGANLKAFVRMDGAWLGSGEVARNKAYTARAFDRPTGDLSKEAQPGGVAFGVADSTDHRIAIFPGGVPLMTNEEIAGAVGVSGGRPDQDQAVAEAGAQAFPSVG